MVLGNTLNILRPPERTTLPVQTKWNEDLVKNMHDVLGRISQQVTTTTSVSTATLTSYATKAALEAATVALVVTSIQLTGYTTDGDGGGALYKRVGSEPSHALKVQSTDGAWWEIVPDAGGIDVKQAGAKGDDSTDNATALAAFFNAGDLSNAVTISQGTYLTGTALVSDDNMHLLVGKGIAEDASGNMIGSVIKASGTGVANLLAVQSLTPASEGTTNLDGLKIVDLGLFHRGSGTGLLIDNIIRPRINNITIDCNSEGAIGLKLDNWAFFATIENLHITNFTDTGLLIDGNGSEHVIRSCHFHTTNDGASAALEIRRPNFTITSGEYEVNRADNTGIGILINNVTAGETLIGGVVTGTLCENNIAVKITGTDGWRSIVLKELVMDMGQITLGVDFDNVRYGKLLNPQVRNFSGGGTLVQWGALSQDCGVVCDINAARAPMTVHASAVRAWMRVTGRILISEFDDVTTDSNLTVICEDVEELGVVTHNGTAWNKNRQTIANDAAISLTPPEVNGLIEVSTSNASGEYVFASFSTAVARAEAFTLGATGAVDITDGTLTGTTGGAGEIMIRADSTSGKVYIQNRLGSSRTVLVRFRSTS